MSFRHLYLLRHGQYISEGDPETDGTLTERGRAQALAAARCLAELPISTIYHSSMRRAVETAAVVAPLLPAAAVRSSDLLRECMPAQPALDTLSPATRILFERIPPESFTHGAAQAEQAFASFALPAPAGADLYELIVSHGNLIRYFVCRALGAPPALWVRTDIHNCGFSQIEIASDGRVLLRSHNESGHLSADLRGSM